MKAKIISLLLLVSILANSVSFGADVGDAKAFLFYTMIQGAEKFEKIQGDFMKEADGYKVYEVVNLDQFDLVTDQYITVKKKKKALIANISMENTGYFVTALTESAKDIGGFIVNYEEFEDKTSLSFGGGKLATGTLTIYKDGRPSIYIIYGK